jgi:hypothetical protein
LILGFDLFFSMLATLYHIIHVHGVDGQSRCLLDHDEMVTFKLFCLLIIVGVGTGVKVTFGDNFLVY